MVRLAFAYRRVGLFGLLTLSLLVCLSVSHAASVTWTNTAASGSFQTANVWKPSTVPGGDDDSSFTNIQTYRIDFSSSALNSKAIVAALGNSTITLNIGSANTWTLTNSFRIATNSNSGANGATVILTNGTLAVTNSAGTGLLNIGETGTGTFILNGGTLIMDKLLATNTGSKSTLTLTKGTLTTLNGSSISNNVDFLIGGSGAGDQLTWNISGGTNRMLLGAHDTIIGNANTAHGDVITVSGNLTVWSNSQNLIVGNLGYSNNLTISGGALVIGSAGQIGGGGSGNEGNSNTVIVTGGGSVWTNSSTLKVGGTRGYNNVLTITSGGAVFNTDSFIGNGGGIGLSSSNQVFVTGSDSRWVNSGTLSIGNSAGGRDNMLIVTNAGLVTSFYGIIGNNADPGNRAIVTSNGTWNITTTLEIGSGNGNNNFLTIADLGTVRATNVLIGPSSGSSGNHIDISGGSLIVTNSSAKGYLYVQRGYVNLSSGTLTADKLDLTFGSSGTFSFGGGNLNVAGTFVTNTFAFVIGDGAGNTATLNFLGGTHNFNNGITNRSDGFITGGGVVQSPLQVVNLGSIIATSATTELRFTNTTTVGNPGTLGAATGGTLTFGAVGGSALVTNFGTISMSGGTFRTGTLTNLANGAVTGFGTFSNNVVNLGSIKATNGTLVMTIGLTNATTGNINIASDGTLSVTPAWVNAGTITNNGGRVAGGTVTNLATGVIRGSGTILSSVVNQGGLSATNGELTLLNNVSGSGAYGAVAGASAATLTFAGGGSISALLNTGATIRVTSILTNTTVFANQGTLTLAGGTYHSAADLSNASTSVIIGSGTLSTRLVNQGYLTATNGTLLLLNAPVQTGTITVASDGTLSVTPAWANSGTLLVMGGTVQGGNLTNTVSGTIRNAGTITSVLINFGDLQAIGGSGLNIGGTTNVIGSTILISNSTINASGLLRNAGNVVLFNSSGTLQAGALNTGSIIVSNSAGGPTTHLDVSGSFVNDSTLNFIHSVATFHSFVANSGTWITDPTTNVYESAFTNATSGVISMAAGDVYIFRTNTTGGTTVGSFVDISTNNVANDKLAGKFLFENTTLALTQNFYAAGHDLNQAAAITPTNQITVATLSPLPAGYFTNFSLGTLEIANFTTVRVWDAFITGGPGTNDNLRAALYVTNLLMGANSFLIISSNVSVYFVTSNNWSAANFTLLGGPVLANQGQLHQFVLPAAVPEPSVLLLWLSGLATVYAARRRNKTNNKRR